jgi:AbrB family looped-hinge helix DNA binding protein
MYYVLHVERMENEVVVTRKGQTTIPVRLRKKFKIEQGTRLEVIETKEGILFKPKLSMWDLVGSGAKYATVEEMYALLDKMRTEDRAEDE